MEQIKIDIVPVGVAPVAHASQFDNSRQIRFNLFNQGTPYTLTGAETVTMVVNGEEENITNTSDNYVIWDVAEEDCAEVGVIGCEIRIVLGSMLIGSKNFFLEVEMDPYNGKNIRTITVGPADICTFETSLAEPLQSVIVDIVATGGNGTPDNPNPIVGYSSANITRCGKNLINNANAEIGTAWNGSPNSARARLVIPCEPSTNYVLTMNGTMTVDGVYFGESETIPPSGIGAVTFPKIFTTANTSKFITLGFNKTNIAQEDIDGLKLQLEKGSTPSAYSAYNGQTYTIAFGQTVYGGVLDVTRGKLTVTHGFKLFTGSASESWDKHGSIASWFFIDNAISDGFIDGTKADFQICNVGVQVKYDNVTSLTNGQFAYGSSNKRFVFKNTDYVDVADFKTWLSNNNMQVAYELATPFDIDLTPEVISAIVGENNVFAGCGQTTVKYLAEG